MNALSLYAQYIKINYKTGLQYKGWPLQLIQVIFQVISEPFGVWLMFSRFGNIGAWSVERVLLIYAIALTSFGLAEVFSRGFDVFPWRLRSGEFDRVLLRPRSLFVQIVGAYFHLHRLSRVAGGIALMALCFARMGVALTPVSLAMLVLALAGGYLAYTGVFVLTSGIAFFTISGLDWIYIFTNASYEVARVPVDYLPAWMRAMFTFFMPMFVVSYYPASVICGWGEPFALGWLAVPAGLAFLLLSTLVWRVGVRRYASTGS